MRYVFIFVLIVFYGKSGATSFEQLADSGFVRRQMPAGMSSPDADHPPQRDVYFKSGKNKLHGRLIIGSPQGRRVPAIIFAVGSGAGSSYANYKAFLRFFFEEGLSSDSVAILCFDKPGIGLSEGKWGRADFIDRAADVKAAADYLKSLDEIDSTKIIVAGHSQGGWIAQVAAAEYPETFAAGISMAGPAFNVQKQVVNDYWSRYLCAGESTDLAMAKANKKARSLFRIASVMPVGPKLKNLKIIRKFEAASYIGRIRSPFLFMFGENDALVSPEWSMEALQGVFKNEVPPHIRTATVGGVNHSFKIAPLCRQPNDTPAKYSPVARGVLSAWIRQVLLD